MYFVVSTNGVCDVRELFLQNIQFAKLKFVCHSFKNYWSNKKQNIWQHEYKYSVIWHIFVNIFVNFFWKTNFLTAWKHQIQGYYMGTRQPNAHSPTLFVGNTTHMHILHTTVYRIWRDVTGCLYFHVMYVCLWGCCSRVNGHHLREMV